MNCRKCGQTIVFDDSIRGKNGNCIPLNPTNRSNHFITCGKSPDELAETVRRQKMARRIEVSLNDAFDRQIYN